MNAIIKVISSVISAINSIIDGIDRNTQETIKQMFFTGIFILSLAGAIIGFYMGKHSAKKSGVQISEFTNSTFETEVRQERDDASFKNMLESELVEEQKSSDYAKEEFPTNEYLEPKMRDEVVEQESDLKEGFDFPNRIERDQVREAERTDDFIMPPDVKRIRDPQPEVRAEIQTEETPSLSESSNKKDLKSEKREIEKDSKFKIAPIQKGSGIIEE